MKLYIDSTNNLKTIVKIDDYELVTEHSSPRDQNTLASIDQLLTQHNLTLKDITKIEVNRGPGSFTGTRVGVAIANALAFTLNLKVNGKEPPLEPTYSQPPNITKSSKTNA